MKEKMKQNVKLCRRVLKIENILPAPVMGWGNLTNKLHNVIMKLRNGKPRNYEINIALMQYLKERDDVKCLDWDNGRLLV